MSATGPLTRAVCWSIGVVVAVALVASCASTSDDEASSTVAASYPRMFITPDDDQRGPSVIFMGDSITVITANQLLERFGDAYRVTVDAEHGLRTDGLAPRVIEAAARKPDIAVINIGTNDAACDVTCHANDDKSSFDGDAIKERFDEFDEAFGPETCVVYVDVNTHNPDWGPDHARMINAHLAGFDNVVDWDGAAQDAWFEGPGDPHPNLQGQRALADLIADEIDDSCRDDTS